MKWYFSIVFALSFVMYACQGGSKVKRTTETLEIFSTKGDSNNKEIDSLQYYESTEYLDGKIATISYFDHMGELTGKLYYEYVDGQLVKGTYEDKNRQVLSYYDFITNRSGQIIAEYGFDARTDELLSIKSYRYNNDGSVANRKLLNGDHSIERSYQFSFDPKGNELSKRVLDKAGLEVMIEQFSNSKVDSMGQWTERWGFVNDEPVTFYKRS